MSKAKSYDISKQVVLEAYKRVKANKGAAGIDEETIKDFDKDYGKNLYKIWNRMSSGSYFPPPVKAVEIPKAGGGKRKLGIPTVGDRIAQMIVKMYLEPLIEPRLHPDSYGYRPGRSGLQAIETARKRCWEHDWVVDIDIKGFFDNIDHELMMKAVSKHTSEAWIHLYISRWLKAPIVETDGNERKRDTGTPQGGVISPLLANLFLHYAFDEWMRRNHPSNPFERYADDIVVHCKTEEEAQKLQASIKERFGECKLEVHPEKTKIVYCKDANRKGEYHIEKFNFLGYTFRPRTSRNRWGKLFVNFSPAISDKATQKIKDEIKSWYKQIRPTDTLQELASVANAAAIGWDNYYGKFNGSELLELWRLIDTTIIRWAKKKYEKLNQGWKKGREWLNKIKLRWPSLFKHWQWIAGLGRTSRMK
jgi:RNA-directed DNA polymerase